MPIYEYRCTSCGHELEALQKLSDAKLLTCPACHQDALVKKVSAAGFQLKGSGWYVTDFRNGNKGGATKKDAATDKGTDAQSGTASDSTGDSAKPDTAKADTPAAASPAAKTETAPAASSPAPAAPSKPSSPSST